MGHIFRGGGLWEGLFGHAEMQNGVGCHRLIVPDLWRVSGGFRTWMKNDYAGNVNSIRRHV